MQLRCLLFRSFIYLQKRKAGEAGEYMRTGAIARKPLKYLNPLTTKPVYNRLGLLRENQTKRSETVHEPRTVRCLLNVGVNAQLPLQQQQQAG